MAKLILMVGNIGTGKSTTANQLMVNASYLNNRDTKIVSNDSISLMSANGYYGPDIWDRRHISLYTAIKQNIVREALTRGFDIIVDGSHMGKISRKAYIDIAKEFGAVVIVYLHTYPDGLQRRIDNPKSEHHSVEVWTDVHNNFAKAYEIPTLLDEGIDHIIEMKGHGKDNFDE
ncbi:hypothetical protein LCGC14_2298280 [marine sediment metagenome]|uniref:Zeta toxin domain-containing protein n=1 Tax=marine sediment metagenome TaxID=412755 RepID=A0A0F9DBS2_9ZZZZ